ncbi:hypothetical protein OG612_41090 [Streptomyces sp. NBC_01527]|uniref:hypothetical protein n=1 Tax=unclassified Streptomyces TaxID=2593676 RepID=UPI002E121DAA|nr:hypothetical protein OG763_01690 [Streptomyces sp. NBC_01230]
MAIPLAALALLTACGGVARDTHPCTLMGVPAGIRVEVHPELAHRVAEATLVACWDAAYQERTLQLRHTWSEVPATPNVVHDGVDRVPIERSLVVDPVVKRALRHLRTVKSQLPSDADPVEFADWRERIAEALDGLGCVLVFEKDRVRAGAEAAAAREQAAEVRRRVETEANKHR